MCVSDAEQQADSSQGPLGRLLFALEVEGPDVCGSPCACLVDGAGVHTPGLLPVYGYGLDEHDRQAGSQLLHTGLRDHARLAVPARPCTHTHTLTQHTHTHIEDPSLLPAPCTVH